MSKAGQPTVESSSGYTVPVHKPAASKPKFSVNYVMPSGPCSSVGIATGYGLDGPGSNPGGGRHFLHLGPWGPLSLLYNGYRVFPGVKSGWGVTLTPHPLLVPWS